MIYKNPVIRGFHPDPSVCRVGSDYYLATSSFEYFPGIPIYHSRDLINWTMINHCIADPRQLDFHAFGNSGGIWAPTIRYHNGRFYVTATVDQVGNMITHTDDINGEWSAPVFVKMGGIDPSIYFEDDRAYYCTNENAGNGEAITLREIDPDTGELTGEKAEIWHGTGGGWLEAPHIYKIKEWYYIFTAEGGTLQNHMVTVGRSRTLFGNYEKCPFNPILTNRNDTSKAIQCTGHADLIDDDNGNWYIVHLGTRPCNRTKSNLGRETFLTPLQYQDDWFSVDGGKAKIENEIDIHAEQKNGGVFVADFTNSKFEKEWLFLNYEQVSKEGRLVLRPTKSDITFAAVRQPDMQCSVKTVCHFAPQNADAEAGLMAYLQSDFYYRLCKKRDAGKDYIVIQKRAGDFCQTIYQEKTQSDTLAFQIEADQEYYYFYCAENNEPMRQIGKASTRFLCVEMPDRCFTGTVIGVYTIGNTAEFSSFSVYFSSLVHIL
ncbi:MAG: glycoside hydrolase family 43 protein [Candidatus Gastranaerophilales bacterium]|nr:glycoside hydrolase family 43 protein [Candidatus Gastranaerophilales bacterium]